MTYKRICLVNSFNYSKYLHDCLNSALGQTIPFDQIIVIDDGSSDSSREIITDYANKFNHIDPIFKINQGQLSNFNAAESLIDINSQIFFLDSDDFYPVDYVELVENCFNHQPWDIAFASRVCFESTERSHPIFLKDNLEDLISLGRENSPMSFIPASKPFELPDLSAIVRALGIWVGMQNSCISISGALFKKIIPYPHFKDWITFADDCFVYASSILGAKKIFLPHIGIYYRLHEQNYHHQGAKKETIKQQAYAKEKLFQFYCDKFSLDYPASYKEFAQNCAYLKSEQKEFVNLFSAGWQKELP
jgi:glycosyltransferase involved in cell wall biosynthesis